MFLSGGDLSRNRRCLDRFGYLKIIVIVVIPCPLSAGCSSLSIRVGSAIAEIAASDLSC